MIVTVCHYTLAVYHDKIALSWFCQMEIAVPFAQALHIDRNRSQPLYRQIAEQIRVQIGEGHLPPGTQLPTVRQLAEIVGVTRVTAQNAYSELQAGGRIVSKLGSGKVGAATTPKRDLPA